MKKGNECINDILEMEEIIKDDIYIYLVLYFIDGRLPLRSEKSQQLQHT